ncbi:CHY zinc finger protein [Microbacterium indicum]|uniref:CHY zinc finger protein n=1 Tax=Microbacterium indicum TaxID=358100 RepID=UPI0004142B94|nr:CHY zinc finger protein [Microbacterium indicum]
MRANGEGSAAAPVVRGRVVDDETRCAHYRSPLDVVAIRFACCGDWYPCHLCHEEVAGHPIRPWPEGSGGELAVLCGVCRAEIAISAYRGASACRACGARFNPGCALHDGIYFGFPAGA